MLSPDFTFGGNPPHPLSIKYLYLLIHRYFGNELMHCTVSRLARSVPAILASDLVLLFLSSLQLLLLFAYHPSVPQTCILILQGLAIGSNQTSTLGQSD